MKTKQTKENIDVDVLMKALDNNDNETLMNLTTTKITEMNLKIIT